LRKQSSVSYSLNERTKYRWQVFAFIVKKLTQTKLKISGAYYLNPTTLVGASNLGYKSYKVTSAMMTDIRFAFRQRQKKKSRDRISRIFAGSEMISFTGRRNPKCGTARKFHERSSRTNMLEMSRLHRRCAFGTAVAKGLRVVESTSRPHCIQIPLSNL
jgi:hypothetical protein